jgi:hypothetical protein
VKHPPLLIPVDPADNRSQVSVVKALDWRQKEDLFLDIGCEIEQLHDLRYAGSRHPAATGQFRIIPNLLLSQQSFKPDRQRHESGDPWNRVANDYWLCPRRAKIECVGDFLAAAHTCTSGLSAA